MRIALVAQEYPPHTAHGGIATQTWAKAHGLVARGHDVHVISASPDGRRVDGTEDGIPVSRLGHEFGGFSPRTEPTRWLLRSAAVALELRALHAVRPFDVVDFPEYGAEGYVHLLDNVLDRIPTLVHLHGPLVMLAAELGWPEKGSDLYRIGIHMEGECIRLAGRIVASSAHSATWCVRAYGGDRAAITIAHVGVDTSLFKPAPTSPDGPPTVVFAGRLAASKGTLTLANACQEVAASMPGLRLRLIGSGSEELISSLRRIADGSFQLDVLGHLPPVGLAETFREAHVVAAPSPCEGGPGFIVLEAMACGRPIVACEGTGVADVVEQGTHGLLVPRDDVHTLAAALSGLLGDHDRREAMGREARRWVVENAEREACIDRLTEIFAETAMSGS